jgi:hypothetical protein
LPPNRSLPTETARARRAADTAHTYLRLSPDVSKRHPVLRGFEETDILPFGGVLEDLDVAESAEKLLTYIPPFPVYPPETSWMREPATTVPGLIVQ